MVTPPQQHETAELPEVVPGRPEPAESPGGAAGVSTTHEASGRWWRLSAPRAILLVLIGGSIGLVIDGFAAGEPGVAFAVGFVTTSVLASVLADRSALFVAGVQPPLAFALFGVVSSAVFGDRGSGQGFLTSVAVDTALWMTTWFPVLAAASVPAAVIAFVRSRRAR